MVQWKSVTIWFLSDWCAHPWPPKFFASYVTILHCGKASFLGGHGCARGRKKWGTCNFQMSGIVTLWLNPWNTNSIPNKRQSFCPITKVFWRLLRFIQGHKWRSFTLQHSCGTKSGIKIRVYRKWYIRVSVNPGVNPCNPPLVFGKNRSKASCTRVIIWLPLILIFFNAFHRLLV